MAWSNLVGYQVVWFVVVIEAGRGTPWPGMLAALVFISWQLLSSANRAADMRLITLAIALGGVVDGVLVSSSMAIYSAPEPAVPLGGAPLWILALWASFSTTLNRSLAYFRDRPMLAAVCAALGGPLAYLGAARGWQAVMFQPPVWRGLLWLGGAWAFAALVLATLARRWSQSQLLQDAPR